MDVEIAAHQIMFSGRLACLAVASDVTDRRLAEVARDETEMRYRLVSRATRDAIWDWDLTTDEVTWNEGVTTLFGYSVPIERNISWWADRLHPEERDRVVAGIEAKIAGTSEFWSDEYRFQRADGTWANILDRGYVIREPLGRPIRMVGAMIDLTEQKRLEEQLRHAQKMDAVGKLAGGVAHDFNNILTAIVGYCDLIQDRLDPGDPLLEEIIEIRKAGERASSLTQHLLAFSRRQVLQPKVLDLNVIVMDMEMILRRLIGEQIELRISADPGLWPIKADPGQIGQVIMNLAVNARDAMPEGGTLSILTSNGAMTRPDARIPSPVPPGDYVTLTVADTGTGIESEVLERIFEPFFTTKERGKGTGLGLSTVYGIVKQSGGEVWVSSVIGTGTVFKMLLPRAAEAAVSESIVVGETIAPSRGTETILLVEDDEMTRRVSHAVLRGFGYSVLEAADAVQALSLAEKHPGPIDLMVSDVVLPGMSGPGAG
jgi:PAS domain S-box-containing protein